MSGKKKMTGSLVSQAQRHADMMKAQVKGLQQKLADAIATKEVELEALKAQAEEIAALVSGGKVDGRKVRRPVTAKRAKAMKMQGTYLGLLRGTKGAGHRTNAKILAKKNGVQAAIKYLKGTR